MAQHVQLSERRFRAVQPDGGLPRGALHASSRPQGRVFCGRLPELPIAMASGVPGPDRSPGQAYLGDDHDREYDLRSAGWKQGGGLGDCLPRSGTQIGKGGWETQTHPHLPISFSLIRGPGTANGRRRVGLLDGQGDGWIPDHPGSGFAARNRQKQSGSYPSALASTGTFADPQPEEKVNIQGTRRVAPGPVEGAFEPSSTGTLSETSATRLEIGSSTGRKATGGGTGMDGEALHRLIKEHLAGPDSVQIHGGGAGADRLRVGSET